MPSFLSKLFRKKKDGLDGASTSASRASSKKSRSKKQKKNAIPINNNNAENIAIIPQQQQQALPPSKMELRRPSNGGTSASNYSGNSAGTAGEQPPHVRVLSPRNGHNHVPPQPSTTTSTMIVPSSNSREYNNNTAAANLVSPNHANHQRSPSNSGYGMGPVDLDESDLISESDENHFMHPNQNASSSSSQQHQERLSVQQLHRFDMQQQKTSQFYMPAENLTRFSAGHVPVPDDMNRSESSASSFNLSTDAEDTEYENLKRRGVVPHHGMMNYHSAKHHNTTLDSSHLSVSSPTNYNTDGDNSIFPALHTDDEGTTTGGSLNGTGGMMDNNSAILSTKGGATTEEDEPEDHDPLGSMAMRGTNNPKTSPTALMVTHSQLSNKSGGADDAAAWTVSPTKDGANPFPFSSHPTSSSTSPLDHNSQQGQPQRRNFTSPKNGGDGRSPTHAAASATTSNNSAAADPFANFADFSNVTFPADTEGWGVAAASNSNKTAAGSSSPDALSPGSRKQEHSLQMKPSSNHGNTGGGDNMSLSDILAQAKGKRSSTSSSHRSTGSVGGGNRRVSSSSVNSAPAITAKYLRQHHNLRSSSRGNGADKDGTTPVSDIIDSLEMANASRSSNVSLGGGSQGGRRSDSSRAAKERMRDRRRHSSSRRRSDPASNNNNNPNESSDGSDHEASESWLFDEVTGALGPRGIAADLESLSGRSKSSSGNKSHKSHRSHRSHRSHGGRSSRSRRKSSNKHHPSSGESVDSRGSRHSRSSRYSHRSTRSYLSQMSEQSRSVANDLLRLEMQLAMVGSQDNNGSAVPGSSASVASRASRKSRSSARRTVAIARRNKVTVQAPPGKLGIILANKADSKGTVVSGVRSSSVLSEKISPGDRIVAIDGEDVSLMTVSEITTIMARKSDFERTLTVLTTPKHLSMPSTSSSSQQAAADARNGMVSPTKSKEYDSYHGRYSNGSGR